MSPLKPIVITTCRGVLAVALVAALALPAAAWIAGARVDENCRSVHTLYVALDRIMLDNDARIDRAVREGILTPKQGRDSHDFNRAARATLRGADCG